MTDHTRTTLRSIVPCLLVIDGHIEETDEVVAPAVTRHVNSNAVLDYKGRRVRLYVCEDSPTTERVIDEAYAGDPRSLHGLTCDSAAVAELIEAVQFDIQRRPAAEGVPAYCPGWCVVDRHGERRGPWCFDADSAISVARAQIAAALARVGAA